MNIFPVIVICRLYFIDTHVVLNVIDLCMLLYVACYCNVPLIVLPVIDIFTIILEDIYLNHSIHSPQLIATYKTHFI